jgi:hypothetical protein
VQAVLENRKSLARPRFENQLVAVPTTLSWLPVGGLSKEILKHIVGKITESSIYIKKLHLLPFKNGRYSKSYSPKPSTVAKNTANFLPASNSKL